jgi:hypothetical protein
MHGVTLGLEAPLTFESHTNLGAAAGADSSATAVATKSGNGAQGLRFKLPLLAAVSTKPER